MACAVAALALWARLEGRRGGRLALRVPPAEPTARMRLAFLVQMSGLRDEPSASALRRLLGLLLDGGRNAVAVHLDGKAAEADAARLEALLGSLEHGGEVITLRRSRVTYKGISMVDVTLRGISALLARGERWRHFLNLSAEDYPLVTMAALRRLLARLNPEANLMELSLGRFGWKQVVIDPAMSMAQSGELDEMPYGQRERPRPSAFSVCKGGAWMVLSRSFAAYAATGGEDGLPRSLLLYFANYARPAESYFQTLIAHSPRFAPTLVPFPMRFDYWPQCGHGGCQHPAVLGMKHLPDMLATAPLIARKLKPDPGAVSGGSDERSELTRWIDAHLLRGGAGNATFEAAAAAQLDAWVLDPARDEQIQSPVAPTSCHESLVVVRDPVQHKSYADGRSRGAKVVARNREMVLSAGE